MKPQINKYQNFFSQICENAKTTGHLSCEILFSVRHTRSQNNYQLLTFHGAFSKETADNNIKPLDSVNISNNESVKIFLVRYDFTLIDNLISSLSLQDITLPNADPNHSKIKHSLDLNLIREITYSSPDARENSTLSFLPHPEDGLTIFELDDTKKNVLMGISQDDIIKIDDMLLKHSLFSISIFSSRVGNILLLAALDPWRISFKGDFDGNGIRIMLVPMRSNLDVNDYALTVTSKEFDEFSGTQIITPIQKSIYIKDIKQYGNIDIRLWDVKSKILCGRNQGVILGSGGVSTYILNQKKRSAILRDSKGNIIKENVVSVTLPSGKYAKRPPTWSQIVQKQINEARKKRLLVQKKLIQYHYGMHGKALEDIIQIINLTQEAQSIKIWDPFIDDYYLDFLTFIESDSKIKVLSELRRPSSSSDEPKGYLKIIKALEGMVLEMVELKYLKKVLMPLTKFIASRRNKRSKENHLKLKKNFKEYLDDLRKRDLKLEFRYKGNGLGESFHDRFLIVDSRCWSLGSSLNHIGSKHCIVMEVEYPELIEQAFDKLWDDVEGNSL